VADKTKRSGIRTQKVNFDIISNYPPSQKMQGKRKGKERVKVKNKIKVKVKRQNLEKKKRKC